MDAWCALWFWATDHRYRTPVGTTGWGGLEAVLGVPPKAGKFEKYGQTSLANQLDWDELDTAEDNDQSVLPIAADSGRSTDSVADGCSVNCPGTRASFTGTGLRPDVRARRLRPCKSAIRLGEAGLGQAGVLAESDPWWLMDRPRGHPDKRAAMLADEPVLGRSSTSQAAQAGS